MTFDKILDNNTLWAVRYDGVADNALQTLLEKPRAFNPRGQSGVDP